MENKPLKRKRKTLGSFLKWERYQVKRKLLPRGTYIDDDLFNYFIRVMEVNISDFSSVEDKEVFIENVFEQTSGREMDVSCNRVGSKATEIFLPWANDKILLRYINALSEDLKNICCDIFGSHVLQQLIVVVSVRLQRVQSRHSAKETSQDPPACGPDMAVKFKSWLQKVGQFFINNLEELVWDASANHIIRTILECFSGLPPGSTSKDKKWQNSEWLPDPGSTVSPIDEGSSLVQECGRCTLQLSQVFDNVSTNLISGLLQTILLTVRKVDCKLCGKIVNHILDSCFMDGSLTDHLMKTHLMEVMISVVKRKAYVKIYDRCFLNKLQPLSLAPGANFCVQSLIKHCKEANQFESIFEELSPNFEALFHDNKHGVLVALAQSCQRLRCKQKEFIKHLQAAFHCVEPDRQNYFPLLVAHWVDYETWSETMRNEIGQLCVSLPGSLLVQTMLNFNEPIKIIKALLAMDIKHLLNVLCDFQGSHIGDAFLDSQMVGEKQKTKFFQKLQGSFVLLVVGKYGSRVLDKIWLWASLKNKKLILSELSPSEDVVNRVHWGSIFTAKCGLSLFKRRPEDWEESQTRVVRAEKLFADIIDT